MADTLNIMAGAAVADSIMYGKRYYPLRNQAITFGEVIPKDNSDEATRAVSHSTWQVNDGWEVEIVSPKRIAIKRFKVDTWGLRQIVDSTHDGYNHMVVRVEGLARVHAEVVRHTAGDGAADGFGEAWYSTGGYQVYWWPGQYTSGYCLKGLVVQFGTGYYNSANEADDGLQMGKHPWDVKNRTMVEDGEVKGTRADSSYRAVTIGLFGGVQDATAWKDESGEAYRVYDISDAPIYIDLDTEDTDAAPDYSSIECWDAMAGDTAVWHKDKTVANCWEKYGYVARVGGYNVLSNRGPHSGEVIVPMVADIGDFLSDTETPPQFHVKAANEEFWDKVKEHASTVGLLMVGIDYSDATELGGTFCNSNIGGTLNLIVLNAGDTAWDRAFAGTEIEELNLTFLTGQLTSCNTAFYAMKKLKAITTNKRLLTRDCSGMFEFASAIEHIPGVFDWGPHVGVAMTRNGYAVSPAATLMGWAFEGCSSLVDIGGYDGDGVRDEAKDTIICGSTGQMFNECAKLVTVLPMLDMRYIRPQGGNKMFYNCRSVRDIRIKGLNHGDWRLDGTAYEDGTVVGALPSLDAESVAYLFANLSDLAGRGELPEYDGTNDGAVASYPEVAAASLYCPAEWADKITAEMAVAATAKGWTVYVGGEVYNQEEEEVTA